MESLSCSFLYMITAVAVEAARPPTSMMMMATKRPWSIQKSSFASAAEDNKRGQFDTCVYYMPSSYIYCEFVSSELVSS